MHPRRRLSHRIRIGLNFTATQYYKIYPQRRPVAQLSASIISVKKEDINYWRYQSIISFHITEVYSPPRVTRESERWGLIPGMAMDLTTNDPDDDAISVLPAVPSDAKRAY